MKTVLLSLFCTLSSLMSFCQNTDSTINYCDYKTGSFYVLKGTDTCYINRTATRQTESCSNSEKEYELIVVWLKEDKYILRDIHYNPTTTPRVMRKDVVMIITEKQIDRHVVLVKIKGQKNRLMTVYCNN